MINKEDIRTMINRHSTTFTIHHIYQELAELMIAVSKLEIALDSDEYDRGYKDCVIEEIADALIMIEIIKSLYGINEDMLKLEVMNKMSRNLKRCGGRE